MRKSIIQRSYAAEQALSIKNIQIKHFHQAKEYTYLTQCNISIQYVEHYKLAKFMVMSQRNN